MITSSHKVKLFNKGTELNMQKTVELVKRTVKSGTTIRTAVCMVIYSVLCIKRSNPKISATTINFFSRQKNYIETKSVEFGIV